MTKDYLVGEFNSCSNTENSLNSIISCYKVNFFSADKNLIFCYYDSGNNIHDLLVYCRKNWPKETTPPNLHILEDHAADFSGTWLSPDRHNVYGEQGAEFIHKIFRLLQRGYCSMQPATIRLHSMLKKEHS